MTKDQPSQGDLHGFPCSHPLLVDQYCPPVALNSATSAATCAGGTCPPHVARRPLEITAVTHSSCQRTGLAGHQPRSVQCRSVVPGLNMVALRRATNPLRVREGGREARRVAGRGCQAQWVRGWEKWGVGVGSPRPARRCPLAARLGGPSPRKAAHRYKTQASPQSTHHMTFTTGFTGERPPNCQSAQAAAQALLGRYGIDHPGYCDPGLAARPQPWPASGSSLESIACPSFLMQSSAALP
jgi:hypothetical protein